MGPLDNLIGMLPGVPKELRNAEIDDGELARIEAIIRSMTLEERASARDHRRLAPHAHRRRQRDHRRPRSACS